MSVYEYDFRIQARQYRRWGALRFLKRFVAYCCIMPVRLVLYPLTAFGNWLAVAFYKLRRW